MRFPYQEIDEIEPDSDQHIQVAMPGGHHHNINPPVKPMLPSWPLVEGVLQIVVGLVTAGLGAVDVFMVPFLINLEDQISLNSYNCYGAVLWSGCLLVLSGSCAVRAYIKQDRTEAFRFYGMSVIAFLGNLALLILIQVCFTKWWTHLPTDVQPYYVMPLLGSISCLLGELILTVTVWKYFCSVMFGNVRMIHSFILCCCPCCSKKIPSTASSSESVHSGDSNLIV